MDPVSVVGLVSALVGTLDVLRRSVSLLNDLRKRLKEADLTVNLLIGQLTAVNAALNQIHLWLDESSYDDENHYQLSLDLESSLTSCHLVIEIMDGQISKLQWDEKDELKFTSRARVVLEDAKTKDCLVYLGNLVSCLSLLLVAFKCRTATDQQKFLEDRRSREVFSQLREDSSSLIVMCDSGSLSSRRTTTTTNTSKYSMRFVFDGELLKHKVYQSTIRALMRRARKQDVASNSAGDKNPSELVAELEAEQQTAKSRQVDKTLKNEAYLMKAHRQCVILGLPGTRTAGLASALAPYDLVKQQSHDEGVPRAASMSNEGYLNRHRILIVKLIIRSLQAALSGLSDFDSGTHHHLEPYVQILRHVTDDMLTGTLPHHVITAITALCKSGVVQDSMAHSVPDSAISTYFLESIERMLAPVYTPTKDDIAELAKHSVDSAPQPQATVDFFGYYFTECNKPLRELQQLAHVFENIGQIVFIIDLAAYDEVETERGEIYHNKLLQNFACLKFMAKSPYFRGAVIFVLLDNRAKFEEKLLTIPLTRTFPGYKGGDDAGSALAYLVSQLLQPGLSCVGVSLALHLGWVNTPQTQQVRVYIDLMEDCDVANAGIIRQRMIDVRWRMMDMRLRMAGFM